VLGQQQADERIRLQGKVQALSSSSSRIRLSSSALPIGVQ
jgi:hypothetical protein